MNPLFFISIFLSPGRPRHARTVFTRFGRCTSAAFNLLVLAAPAFLLQSCAAEPRDPHVAYNNIYVEGAPANASSMDLFFFDDTPSRRLDSYLRLEGLEGNRFTANSSNRASHVVLLSNVSLSPYEWSGIDTYTSLSQHSFILDEEDCSAHLLSGEAVLEAGWSRACVLSLQTSLTRVRLHQLGFDFSGRQYSGAVAEDIRLYLTRACTECLPLQGDKGVTWMNTCGADSVTLSQLAHPEYLFTELEGSVGKVPVECDIDFYTYPNGNIGIGETRFVVECTVSGRKTYYPLPLPPLKRSTTYELDVLITRMGTDDPDTPAAAGTAEVALRVLPWEYASSQTVTF